MSLAKKYSFRAREAPQAQGMRSFRDYYVNNKDSFRRTPPASRPKTPVSSSSSSTSSSVVDDAPTVSLTGVLQGRLSLADGGIPALSLTGVMQGRLSLTPTG